MSGYGDQAARADMDMFLEMVEKPCGVHLCGNPDHRERFLSRMQMRGCREIFPSRSQIAPSIARIIHRIAAGFFPDPLESRGDSRIF